MKSKWVIRPISEIVNFNPKYSVKKGALVPYVEMAAVPEHNREIAYFEEREFKGGGSKFQNGDTLFSRITPCLQNGKTAKVSGLGETQIANGSTEFIVMSAKDHDNDQDFVYYLTLDKEFRKYAEGRMEGTTGRQRVSWQALAEYKLPIPPKDTRKKIAHILSTLDDKIELNRKMNETLEAMAQALFKSWFVDFDPVHARAKCTNDAELEAAAKELGISKEVLELFPSEFVESEMGMIPLGWEVKPFSHIAKLDTSSIKPFDFPHTVWKHFSIPAFDSNDYPILELGSEIKSNKYKVDNNAVLSSKLNPHTPRTWIPNIKEGDSAICSTEFMQFVPLENIDRSYIYLLITSKYFQDAIKSRVTGTTGSRQRAQPKQVAEIAISHPPKPLIDTLVNIVAPIISQKLENIEEVQVLQKTRDTLLPKLLSGELDVSEIEL